MKTRNFWISNSAKEKLAGVEVLPGSLNHKLPAVILVHGFAYYKEEDGIFTGMAEVLAQGGYATYYFDFSGCGESEGNYEAISLSKLVTDLQTVVDIVSGYEYLDSSNLSFIGQSFGTSVIIAAQILQARRIVLCGALDNAYKLISELMDEFDPRGISKIYRSSGKVTTIGPQFWDDLKQYDLPHLIAQFTCPVLFIHGAKDTIVPVASMERLRSQTQQASTVILPLSDHGLEPERGAAFSAVEEFFAASGSGRRDE